jgi:hypothetical protein
MANINDLPLDLRGEVKKHHEGSIEIIDFDRSNGGKGYLVLFHNTWRFGLCLNGQSEFGDICDYRLFPDDREYYYPGWYISVNSLRWENSESDESFSIDTTVALQEAKEAGKRWARTINCEPVHSQREFKKFCFGSKTFPDFPYDELYNVAVEGAWEELEKNK